MVQSLIRDNIVQKQLFVIRNPWPLVNDLMRISLQLTTNQSQVGEGVEDMKREQVSDAFSFKLFIQLESPPCMITLMIFRIMYLLIMSTVPQGQLKVRIARIEESLELIMEIMQSRRPAVDRN